MSTASIIQREPEATSSRLKALARDIARLRGSHRHASTVPLMRAIDIAERVAAARPLLPSEAAFFAWAEEQTGLRERQVKTHLALASQAGRLREHVRYLRQSRVQIDPRYFTIRHCGRLVEVVTALKKGEPPPPLPDRRRGAGPFEQPRLDPRVLLRLLTASVEWADRLEQELLDAGGQVPALSMDQARLINLGREKAAAAASPGIPRDVALGEPRETADAEHPSDDADEAMEVDGELRLDAEADA
jgi:hypothetical protein